MAHASMIILLVGVCLGITAGRFVLDETEFVAEDEDGLIGDPDVDLDKFVLQAILRGEISLEELLEEGIVQDLETRLESGPLKDVGWSKCMTINAKILRWRVHTQVCVSIEYLRANIGYRVTIQIGRYRYVKEISVRNPLPLCYGIPGVRLLKACIQFYNINISNRSGCVRLKVSFLSWNVGCFKFLHVEEHLSQQTQAARRITMPESVKKPNMVTWLQE